MNNFISKNFSYILVGTFWIGFIIPSPGQYSSYAILFFLFSIIFASFFQLDLDKKIIKNNLKKTLRYYVFRFLIIPMLVYFIFFPFSDFFAVILLLLMLLPSAVSSPAVTAILKANVNLSLTIVVFSNLLSIIFIPLFSIFLIKTTTPIAVDKLLFTLLFTIILPLILSLLLRNVRSFKTHIVKQIPLITIIGLSSIAILAIAKNKETILNNLGNIVEYLAIALVAFIVIYALGWFLQIRNKYPEKASFSVTSGLNNIGLGISLTALYFPADISIFFAVAIIAWVVMLIPVKIIIMKQN